MNIITIALIFLLAFISSCTTVLTHTEKVVIKKTTFFDANGDTGMVGKYKLWQRDSIIIQENYSIKVNSVAGRTTTTYIPIRYRLMNLSARSFYDFYSFSDTANCYKKGEIDRLTQEDGGTRYFIKDMFQFAFPPQELADTLIGNTMYHRIKYYSAGLDSTKNFFIGLFPANEPYTLFSLEHKFSSSRNWFMKKHYEYYNGRFEIPAAIMEVDFIAKNLSPAETKVFNAWEQYAREHPVK